MMEKIVSLRVQEQLLELIFSWSGEIPSYPYSASWEEVRTLANQEAKRQGLAQVIDVQGVKYALDILDIANEKAVIRQEDGRWLVYWR